MILYSPGYATNPFKECFDSIVNIQTKHQLKANGALILWGGEDISPQLYNQRPNKFVTANIPSYRDLHESSLIKYAVKHDIPIIGICRGAQLLCAMAGGSLVQHIQGHHKNHKIILDDENSLEIETNSSHHQMMLPPDDAVVLAYAAPTIGFDQFNNEIPIPKVNEVVYFPNMRGIGIQPHPEWASCPKEFVAYCERVIKEYIL